MIDYMTFPEADWKTLRKMKDALVRRASTRALERIESIVSNREADPHTNYLELWRVLRHEDEMIGRMLDDLKRSNARLKLSEMFRNNLLTTREIEAFIQETRDRIIEMSGANQAMQPTGIAGG